MTEEAQDNQWPESKFYFLVTIGEMGTVAFTEVSGLDAVTELIEYRASDNNQFSTIGVPGIRKSMDVTLKKGMLKGSAPLLRYLKEVEMNTIQRETVTIQLMDEAQKPVMVWKLHNALPIKVTLTALNAEHTEIAIETLVFANEGLEIISA